VDILELLKTPIPVLLAVAGILLVIWAVINSELQIVSLKFPKPTTRGQRIAAAISGVLFLVVSISLYLIAQSPSPQTVAKLPTDSPPATPTATATQSPTPTETPTDTPTLSAAATVPQPAVLGGNVGEIVNGGAQVWLYEGQQDEILTIRVYADKPADTMNQTRRHELGLLDSTVTLLQPDGTRLAWDDDPAGDDVRTDSVIQDVKLPNEGEYQIIVRSVDNATSGKYTLAVHSNIPKAQSGRQPDLTIAYIRKLDASCDSAQVPGSAKRRSPAHVQDNPPPISKCFIVEVINIGGLASEGFEVTVNIPEGDGEVSPMTVSRLQPGESVEVNIPVAFNGEGSMDLPVIADSGNSIVEEKEDNNSRIFHIDIIVES
jgi:hypothetical protein